MQAEVTAASPQLSIVPKPTPSPKWKITDPLVLVHFDINGIGIELESLVAAGIEIVKAQGDNKWALGDIGVLIKSLCLRDMALEERAFKKTYAAAERRDRIERSLRVYAKEIGVEKDTMLLYCRMSEFYPSTAPRQLKGLTWSHYYQARRLGNLDAAIDLLQQPQVVEWAASNELKLEVNRLLGNPPPLKKLPPIEGSIDEIIEALQAAKAGGQYEGRRLRAMLSELPPTIAEEG